MPLPTEYDLTGKVAFVTGAGRGIGLAEAGADVVVNALTPTHVVPLAADIARVTGRRVVPLVADVTRSDEIDRAMARILSEPGALDVLVNNLGDSIRKPFETVTDDDLKLSHGESWRHRSMSKFRAVYPGGRLRR